MLSPFLACLTEELTKRGYGDKRQAEIVDRFQGLRESYVAQGASDPDTLAMAQVLAETEKATREKQRRAYTTLLRKGEISNHFDSYQHAGNSTPASAALALVSMDPRSKSGLNAEVLGDVYKGQLWAAMQDVVEKMGKGKFGFQKGKAYMEDVVDEIFGKATGSDAALEIAAAWNKGAAMVVDLWNHAGGTMNKLDRWGLPQMQSLAKVIRNGGESGATWRADHMNWLDWDRMRWPNGAPIKLDQRDDVLKAVWETLASDGANKIDPEKWGGNGAAMGNMIDQHRFMIFKDGQAWKDMHAKYGDGTVFDVMTGYIESVSYKMGLVRTFGPNPEAMMNTVKAMALSRAEGAAQKQTTAAVLKNKFDPVAEQVLRKNSMDPESTGANIVMGAGNLLNSAQLAGAVLAAIPGDFATTMVMRSMNNLPVLDGLVGQYARNVTNPAEMTRLAVQSGFVTDEVVHSIFTKSRFSGVAEYGPAWTKRTSDVVMRASGMNLHTNALRGANQREIMGAMWSMKGTDFDALPIKPMMEKYGITAADWNRVRELDAWRPYDGVEWLRPSDILGTSYAGKQQIFERFQSMILQESRYMVPNSTVEATVTLKGNLRPDTLPGALLHSFAMYKNFPVSLALMYGRVALSIPSAQGRLGFVAALGSSLLLAGATGLQLREMSKGRDPLPMDRPEFWGKAMLASGAMSLWGDFLFTGVNRMGQGPTEMAAGPIVSFAGDTTQLAFGKMFQFADQVGTLKADKMDKSTPWGATAVEYASRYTPGSSLSYGRLALQRAIFDPLRAIADPRGVQKMDRKERQRVEDFGNESWWAPGTPFPQRPPGAPVGRP